MRRVAFLALVCVLSISVPACGYVRDGLPTAEAGVPIDARRAADAQGSDAAAPSGPTPTRDAAPDVVASIDPPRTRGLGGACAAGSECGSGSCVDGVCCESRCDGLCEACDLPGSAGSCLPVTGAPRGARAPCLGQGSACAGRCDGAQRMACSYPAGETECGPAACDAGLARTRSVCSGTGVCLPPAMVSCAPFTCRGDICAGGCSADSPCVPGNFCSGGRCLPLGAAGAACTAPRECQSGFCASGRCCDRACTGACEACDRPGRLGTCSAMSFDADLDNCGGCGRRCSTNHIRAACAGGSCDGACSEGFADCNGSKRNDGCEVNVATSAQNCGACGNRCPGTACQGGTCEKIELTFSFVGEIAGQTCISINEPADPHFWSDNFLCTQRDFGLRWSVAGELPGMVCTQITEPSDPDFWGDNFLCAPADYGLRWSFVGPIAGMRCTQVNEPADPNFWSDNYLCAPP